MARALRARKRMNNAAKVACCLALGVSAGACNEVEVHESVYWGNSMHIANASAFEEAVVGCPLFGSISREADHVDFEIGYDFDMPLPTVAAHMDAEARGRVDDGALPHRFSGVVLLVVGVIQQIEPELTGTIVASDVLRVGVPAADLVEAEFASISGALLDLDKAWCSDGQSECFNELLPTFVVIYDDAPSGSRAYQFIRPYLDGPSNAADCGAFSQGDHPASDRRDPSLLVYAPLLEQYAQEMDGVPNPASWPSWIDEALPR